MCDLKHRKGFFSWILALAISVYIFNTSTISGNTDESIISTEDIGNRMLIPGGIPVGIYMDTSGIMIIGTESIADQQGEFFNTARNIVQPGDYIIKINGIEIHSKNELVNIMGNLESGEVILTIRRNEEEIDVKLDAVLTENGGYKLGIWVRDNIQGLGTLSYIDEENNYGSLGHGIYDIDTNGLLQISNGELYNASVNDVIKGEVGVPGGIEGVIVYNPFNVIGNIEKNTEYGIYGKIESLESLELELTSVEMARKEEITTGKAEIRSTLGTEIETYDVEILELDYFADEINKTIVLQVTDSDLIAEAGGIVQGMSGSPILQNGKIIGAVTHVFVNDPTKGYGIFIEDMLEVAEE